MATDWATVASTRRKSVASKGSPVAPLPSAFSEPSPTHKPPLYKSSRPQGVSQAVQSKWGAATNKRPTATVANPSKLDQETEELRHFKLTRDMGILIQKGRQGKGWSQRELAMKINEKPQVIAEYEAGKGVKNNAVIAKIETVLGVKIRDKK